METVRIETTNKIYDVTIGQQAIGHLGETIRQMKPAVTKISVMVDESVLALYSGMIEAALEGLGDVVIHPLPAGEAAKSFAVYEEALGVMLKAGLDRHSLLIAIGGGATGDLAGFVAASYMRGIRFIQVPTTILAHDSAVGGKVAINHTLGKNMVGAFHQPSAVLYDLAFLATLPAKEIRSGFAEVIKHALIADPAFLQELMEEVDDLEAIDPAFLAYALKKGIEIKGKIVKEDERELGVRAFLNFGHTYGHAIESAAGYGSRTHGECVMTGMLYALYLSEEKAGLEFDRASFTSWVRSLGYHVEISTLPFETLYEKMTKDKKTIGQEIRFVLLKAIGEPILSSLDRTTLQRADHTLRSQ